MQAFLYPNRLIMNPKEAIHFEPDAERYQRFDIRMRMRLVASLRYLHEFTQDDLDIPQSLLEQGLNLILEAPIMPDYFASYYELVEAIQDEDYQRAQALFEETLNPAHASDEIDIFQFQDPESDPRSKRFKTKVDTEPQMPFPIHPVDDTDFARARELIYESIALLERCAPELHAEVEEILCAICIGAGPKKKGDYTFDGASAFELWGSILLNGNEAKDVVDMVQTLAHETCHVMLFGYCIDGTLVNNPDDERYASPLRVDPRPIDGIYHATFVLARMYYSAEKLRDSGLLSPELQTKVESELEQRAKSFYDGLGTLKAHADYSPNGAGLIASAEAYMDSVCAF